MAHRLYLKQNHRRITETWDPVEQLATALEQRARFLEKYPQYQTLQNEIDAVLDKAGSPENRMAVLALLMEAKLIELHSELKHLNRILLKSVPAEGLPAPSGSSSALH